MLVSGRYRPPASGSVGGLRPGRIALSFAEFPTSAWIFRKEIESSRPR